MPVVDQVECHAYTPCDDLRKELNKIHCLIEAWSPIGRGNRELFQEKVLVDLGNKYNKTVPQVILRWHIEKGNIIFPFTICHLKIICSTVFIIFFRQIIKYFFFK